MGTTADKELELERMRLENEKIRLDNERLGIIRDIYVPCLNGAIRPEDWVYEAPDEHGKMVKTTKKVMIRDVRELKNAMRMLERALASLIGQQITYNNG